MTEWRHVCDTNVEVSDDGRVRRSGIEFVPNIDGSGYRQLWAVRKSHKLHRLIAIAFIPNPLNKPCVDHIDGNTLNNAISNLRWATLNENMRNRKPYVKNSNFPRGVFERGNKFYAYIYFEGQKYDLGTYDSPEEASEVYEVTAAELFGEFYRAV